MLVQRVTGILLSVSLLCASGCSSARLRNLISRSDYKSLEELEAQESPDNVALAASTETTDEADAEGKPARRGLFNLVSFLSRDKDEEISPDPFVESDELAVDEASDNRVAPIAESDLESLKAEGRSVAEFDSATEFQPSEADDATRTAAAFGDDYPGFTDEGTVAAENINSSTFTEFMGEMSAAEAAPDFEQAVHPLVAEAEASRKEVDDQLAASNSAFDDFLESGTSPEQPPSQLFRELEDFMKDTPVPEITAGDDPVVDARPMTESVQDESPFAQLIAGQEPRPTRHESRPTGQEPRPTSHESQLNGDDFEEFFGDAAKKHGFSTAGTRDPWSFLKPDPVPERGRLPEPAGTTQPAQGFTWNSTPEPKQEPAIPQPDAADQLADDGSEFWSQEQTLPSQPEQQSPFQMASAIDETDPFPAEDPQAFPEPLVIPVAADSEPAADIFDDAENYFEDDPFLQEQLDAGMQAENESEASPVETTAGVAGGFSTRTWFLLLGVIIVALLLFLPERQKQNKAQV